MKHTEDAKKKMSAAGIRGWADPANRHNSEEYREGLSERAMKLRAEGIFISDYTRTKGGRRQDLGGTYFRSAWEANYARYLNWMKGRGEIHDWAYEADTFYFAHIKRGCRSYTPDFKVWDKPDSTPRYVEVKGWMDQKSKTKLARMARFFPTIRLEVFGAKDYASLRRELSKILVGWE